MGDVTEYAFPGADWEGHYLSRFDSSSASQIECPKLCREILTTKEVALKCKPIGLKLARRHNFLLAGVERFQIFENISGQSSPYVQNGDKTVLSDKECHEVVIML
jgi:hypothetical protein